MKHDNQGTPPGYTGPPRAGGWIQTFTGIPFWPLDPRPEEIDPRDVAHALAHQCRFAGHCAAFYSVAEHCLRVSTAVAHEDALWALLHDAPEAYLVDVPRPLKRTPGFADGYRAAEARLMTAICVRFGLPDREPPSVQRADAALLHAEARDLLNEHGRGVLWAGGIEPHPAAITPLPPSAAEHAYLHRLNDLYDTRHSLEGGPA